MENFSEKVNFIWSIADLIRGPLKRVKYQDVILPFTSCAVLTVCWRLPSPWFGKLGKT